MEKIDVVSTKLKEAWELVLELQTERHPKALKIRPYLLQAIGAIDPVEAVSLKKQIPMVGGSIRQRFSTVPPKQKRAMKERLAQEQAAVQSSSEQQPIEPGGEHSQESAADNQPLIEADFQATNAKLLEFFLGNSITKITETYTQEQLKEIAGFIGVDIGQKTAARPIAAAIKNHLKAQQ